MEQKDIKCEVKHIRKGLPSFNEEDKKLKQENAEFRKENENLKIKEDNNQWPRINAS